MCAPSAPVLRWRWTSGAPRPSASRLHRGCARRARCGPGAGVPGQGDLGPTGRHGWLIHRCTRGAADHVWRLASPDEWLRDGKPQVPVHHRPALRSAPTARQSAHRRSTTYRIACADRAQKAVPERLYRHLPGAARTHLGGSAGHPELSLRAQVSVPPPPAMASEAM